MNARGCPPWCTVPHQPGANPRRQSHLHTLVLKSRGGWRTKVEMYPFPSQPDIPGGSPNGSIKFDTLVTFRKGYGKQRAMHHLSVEDARALAASLTALADAAERERVFEAMTAEY